MPIYGDLILDDYIEAGRRMYNDADVLFDIKSYPTATHLYGLAAECAIKEALKRVPGGEREIPRKHIPLLLDDAKRWLSGRSRTHLFNVIKNPDYMSGWDIGNRYWPNDQFDERSSKKIRRDALKALSALGGGV